MNEEEKKAIEKLTNGEKITIKKLMRKMIKEGIERFIITRPEYIHIILNLIEKLQKENEEWQKVYQEEKDKQFELIKNTNNIIKTANIAIKDLQEKLKEVISVQKVKDKIEELNNNRQYLSQFNDYKEKDYTNEEVINNCVEVLQELIEEREEKRC